MAERTEHPVTLTQPHAGCVCGQWEPKNKQVIVRLTATERAAFDRLADRAGLTLSEFTRRKVLGDQPLAATV